MLKVRRVPFTQIATCYKHCWGTHDMRSLSALMLLPAVFACEGKSRPERSDLATGSNTCSTHPALPRHSAGHVRILASMLSADRKAGRSTFGFPPPDSSQIRLVTDTGLCAKADSALYDALIKMGGTKSSDVADNGILYLYQVGSLYAVTDLEQSPWGDLTFTPIFFFFDPQWHYLGNRST
jgi:hypothetical protein